jgi:hypothetical protein
MRVQHNSPDPPDPERKSFAALPQGFPKAVVELGQIGANRNRTFAAPLSNVSVAGQTCH